MNPDLEFVNTGNHSRTNLLVLLKNTTQGFLLVNITVVGRFPGPLSNIEVEIRKGRTAAEAQGIQALLNRYPELPPGTPFRYFDWSLTELKSTLLISQVPTPGVIIAICEVVPLGPPPSVALFPIRAQLQKHPDMRDFLTSPDARTAPVRPEQYDVFISYASEDSALAMELRERLLEQKHTIFLAERSISLASRWEPAIRLALQQSRVVVVLVTPNSINSEWVIFEAGAAWALDVPIAVATLFVPVASLPGALSNYQNRPYETDRQRADFVAALAEILGA